MLLISPDHFFSNVHSLNGGVCFAYNNVKIFLTNHSNMKKIIIAVIIALSVTSFSCESPKNTTTNTNTDSSGLSRDSLATDNTRPR